MKKILFVDDEPEILSSLKNLLRRQRRQWEMSFAVGGEEALKLLEKECFDVVVSDMRMPQVDGVAVLKEVQKSHPEAVRIVLSGYADQAMSVKASQVAHQFLNKPCEAGILRNTLQRACDLQDLISDEAIRRIVGKIGRLPALPRIYGELTQALSQENTNARKVASILKQDMAVCAKLLQMVNSSFFRLARKVTSIEQAVTYLGIETIRSLTLAAKVFDPTALAPKSKTISFETLQEHALHMATISKRIAPPGKEEDAFTAGMLQDLGLLILAVSLPREIDDALNRSRSEQIPLHQIEFDLFGTSHAEVGAYLLGLWGLPYPVIEAVAHHHQPDRVPQQEFDLLAVIHTAQLLSQETSADCQLCSLCGPLSEDMSYWQALDLDQHLDAWRTMVRAEAEY